MSEPVSYRIEHVADFLKVPADRRAACLEEFTVWIDLADHFAVLFAPEFLPPEFKSFTWIDDGFRNVTVKIDVKDAQGGHLASSTIGPLPYAEADGNQATTQPLGPNRWSEAP